MSDSAMDPVRQAAMRLEMAVARLAETLPAAFQRPAATAEADMVPRAEVAALSARLDAAVARLRLLLQEEGLPAEEAAEGDDPAGDASDDDIRGDDAHGDAVRGGVAGVAGGDASTSRTAPATGQEG